jgi:HAD superfamily hydrolase (TIGR01509 family)
MTLDAVIFDFDGLIFDSETPIYRASAAALAEMGHAGLTEAQWSVCIGLGEDDSWAALCTAIGAELDRDDFEARYHAQDRAWRETLPPLPGVEDLLAALAEAGVPCGVASSSSCAWVEGNLERLGLLHRFAVVAGRDRVGGRSKPAPDSYLYAVAELGADPDRTVALEDSAPGIAAAQAAGLTVVAVPSAITIHTDLSAADHTVTDLTHLTIADLERLVEVARSGRGEVLDERG